MGCLDSFVKMGQKFLPPPGVLFITHLLYTTLSIILFFIEDLVYSGISNTCNGWIQWILLVVAILMSILVAYAKYKEKEDAMAAFVSLLLFFATIIGLQLHPFGCFNFSNWGSTLLYYIIRGAICIPLAIIYFFVCKSDLDSLKPQ
ncbi:uncharacterized protein LOC134815677 [Bolinopsis microptera]|uniref:uncharacterized protein LOC134815677 n=1 Tax=Bolinopsis microptera TaxID=2820187 RepID=UPI0030790553